MNEHLQAILARCVEVGDCLEWQGRMKQTMPHMSDGKGGSTPVRRVVYELANSKPIPAGRYPIMTCRNERCVNPAHIRPMDKKQIGALMSSEGRYSTPQRAASISAGRRRSSAHRKLGIEQVREIRSSSESLDALAQRYGVNRSTVWQIQRGHIWREAVPAASVFSWGGMAA